MTNSYTLEACVESLEEARIAEARGADQIELCDQLEVGGVTPPRDLIQAAQATLQLKIKVMIRPRGGSFVHTPAEIDAMRQSIQYCKSLGIPGVVFGILTPAGRLDLDHIQDLAALARPMEVTIHRAIDEVPDVLEAIEKLMNIPDINSVLSAGQASSAYAGRTILRRMVELAGERLTIIPGGGVTRENVGALHQFVGSSCYHGTKIVGPLIS
jgi:copper homeostasis protein